MPFNYKFIAISALFCVLVNQSLAQYTYSQNAADRANFYNSLLYRKAKEEGRNLSKWWKGELSVGIALAGATNYSQQSKYDPAVNPASGHDSLIKGKAQGLIGLHLNANSNHMLARLGTSSILSLSVGYEADILRWKYQVFNGNLLSQVTTSLFYAQLGVPVTIDYKWGCDVDFQPEMKSCFAVGAGAMPLGRSSFDNLSNVSENFRVSPYLYASFGVYMWGCWKIRVAYMPGKFDIFKDLKSNIGGTITTLNAQSGSIFTISIAQMSRSRDWGKGSAWRQPFSGGGHHYHRHPNGMRRMF